MLKNAEMQGARYPEERGVLGCTPQRRRMRATLQMGVFQHPVKLDPPALLSQEGGSKVLKDPHESDKVLFLLIGELQFSDQIEKLHRIFQRQESSIMKVRG